MNATAAGAFLAIFAGCLPKGLSTLDYIASCFEKNIAQSSPSSPENNLRLHRAFRYTGFCLHCFFSVFSLHPQFFGIAASAMLQSFSDSHILAMNKKARA